MTTGTSERAALVSTQERGDVQVLKRFLDLQPFAYTHDRREYRRFADNSPWALDIDGWIVSARSGRPLAFRIGRFFLEPETLSLLYYVSPPAPTIDDDYSLPTSSDPISSPTSTVVMS